MYGNISDEEANELIKLVSENVSRNVRGRSIVETPLFPVSHYIHTAVYVLYDQSFQYNIMKEVAKVLPPEEFARRNKTFSVPWNQLSINSFAMLYLHGRAQVLYDNIQRKKRGESIEVEPEEKKKETKFLLDYWKRLSPNYRNDGKLTADDGTIRIISQDFVDTLRQEMIPVKNKPELVKQIKRTTAILTSRAFLAHGECRAGIFEQGPYKTDSPDEVLIFKDFMSLYTGDFMGLLDDLGGNSEKMMPLISHIKTKVKAPVDNVIFGMTLKNMEELSFNDWGTMFAKPSDFTQNITSVGLWTREQIPPKDMRYPDNLGAVKKLSFDTLKPLQVYAQGALDEMYVEIANWDFLKKLTTGLTLYANAVAGVSALYADLVKEFDFTWPMDVLNNEQHSDLISTKAVKGYIEKLGKFAFGAHPFISRIFRPKKKINIDPFYYYLQD